jgi:AcrR family transcriptional regulator
MAEPVKPYDDPRSKTRKEPATNPIDEPEKKPINEVGKKPYSSALRTAQARATRRAIVDAAARLFVERGYGATTVDAIADEAGVSRKTVFTSVGGKAEALRLAIDWAIVGDDEPVALIDRPQIKAAEQEPDARRLLSLFAELVHGIGERIARLNNAVNAAAGLDTELRALAEAGRAQRLHGTRAVAQALTDRDALKPDLTTAEAADILWLFNDPAVYHRLVLEQHWPANRYETWLADTLTSLLIAPDYQPGGAS